MNDPYIPLFVGDWLRDDVAGCSLAAQGLWLRMMFMMHDGDRYGYLSKNGVSIPPERVAARCNTTLDQYTTLLAELDSVGVPRRTSDGVIYSKRMVEDDKKRKELSDKRAQAGKKGGLAKAKQTSSKSLANADAENEVDNDFGLVPDFSTADVEEIYNAYPLKVEKPAALSEIGRALKRCPKAKLLAAVKAYAAATARWPQERKINIHKPDNWFRTQKYLDDPKAWDIYAAPAQQLQQGPRGIRIVSPQNRGAQ